MSNLYDKVNIVGKGNGAQLTGINSNQTLGFESSTNVGTFKPTTAQDYK